MKQTISTEFNSHIILARNALNILSDSIEHVANTCINSLNNGGKILLFGNGGSAADAQHIAAELVGRYKVNREALAAIALTTDSSTITSISNDFGYRYIFDRQLKAIAKSGDVAIGISTSGKSDNVISALKLSSELKCIPIGFCGQDDELMNKICKINLAVPSNDTPRIQEIHILIAHIICQLIEQNLKTN